MKNREMFLGVSSVAAAVLLLGAVGKVLAPGAGPPGAEGPNAPPAAITGEQFAGVMGYDGTITTETSAGDWNLRTYHTAGDARVIAETFGFGAPQDYAVDLDGDGVTELAANVQFGGDGARRAYVYQRRGDDIYLGSLSTEGLPNFDNWGANAAWSEYDPAEGVFRLHYAQKQTEELGLLETASLERFTFSQFEPTA